VPPEAPLLREPFCWDVPGLRETSERDTRKGEVGWRRGAGRCHGHVPRSQARVEGSEVHGGQGTCVAAADGENGERGVVVLVSLPSKPAVSPSVGRDEWYSVVREGGDDVDDRTAVCGRLKECCSLVRSGGDNEYGTKAYLSDCCRLGLANRFPNSAVQRRSVVGGVGDYRPLVVGSVQAVR
jgi:hypothetical protein